MLKNHIEQKNDPKYIGFQRGKPEEMLPKSIYNQQKSQIYMISGRSVMLSQISPPMPGSVIL